MSNTAPSVSDRSSLTYSACAQTSGIAEPDGSPGASSRDGNRRSVPDLLRDEPAGAGLRFDGREQRLRLGLAPGGQRVMRALAGQQRPDPADADAVERPPVRLFAVAVEIVAPPARALREIDLQHLVDDRDRVENAGIVGGAQAEPHERERVRADERVGGHRAGSGFVIAHLDQPVEVGAVRLGRFRRDADVVAR